MDRSSDNLGQTISNIQRDLEELKSNQGQGGGGGGGGGEEYFAGNGIEIDQSNTISINTDVVATKTELDSKQDKLTAGSHISISDDNTISATGISTVNDGTLTITQNDTTVGTFSANQSNNAIIALTDTTYSDMTGATISTAGTGGLVPAPSAGDQDKFLRGDGTWTSVTPGGGEDTGWVDLRPYMVSTNVYEARPGNYYPKARRINGIVYLSGEIYCKVSVGVMTSTLLENIPEIFVPDTPEGQANGSGVCYELSNSYYMIFIETMANGKGRIRISQPYTKIPSTGNYQGYSLNGISPYPGK